jgi:ABC-2 type transport system permease protein
VRTALIGLRRDRGALALSFILPIAFFSIFAVIFGGQRDTTPKVSVLVVDEDHSAASQRLDSGAGARRIAAVKTKAGRSKGRSNRNTQPQPQKPQ